jgi:hypothetical protein
MAAVENAVNANSATVLRKRLPIHSSKQKSITREGGTRTHDVTHDYNAPAAAPTTRVTDSFTLCETETQDKRDGRGIFTRRRRV